jgi:hypothetical protein
MKMAKMLVHSMSAKFDPSIAAHKRRSRGPKHAA